MSADTSPQKSKKELKEINKRISRELKLLDKECSKHINLLLLGTGECGKSTIVKQMKMIHGNGYSGQERKEFVGIIHQNIIVAMRVLYEGLSRFGSNIETPELEEHAQAFFDGFNATITAAPHDLFKQLWADSGIQAVYSQRRLLQLSDSTGHYMESLSRICAPGFNPTDTDILYARIPTKGVHEYMFHTQNPDVTFRMTDVGGQKAERRKWMECFNAVTSVIFVTALSDFDQMAAESEGGGNRLQESLKLFKQVMKGKHLQKSTVILFLNKLDLFKEKLEQGSEIKRHFPEYKGVEGHPEQIQEFILRLFSSQKAELYPHFTTAIDTTNIKFVFKSVKDTLIQERLKSFGIA